MGEKRPTLVLFDIDGTLVHCGPTPRRAFRRALERTFGTAGPIDGWIFDGKTDPLIVRELMEAAGVAWNGELIDSALSLYVEGLARELPEERKKKVLPGVLGLLETLGECGIPAGLLTGNIRAGAKVKLESLGLWRSFPFGGFADDSPLRSDIATAAVRRAKEFTGREFSGAGVVIIGDTPHDMRCGRHLGARAVGVATGRSPVEELLAHGAAHAFADLADTTAVLAAILAE